MSSTAFGEHLKREREMRGVSLEEISAATRISTRFLEALENGQWEQLPGGAFNRGFIRSTARFLGLNEDSMVAEYALETKDQNDSRTALAANDAMPRDFRPLAVAVGVLVLLIVSVIYGVHLYHRARLRKQQAYAAAQAARAGQESAATSPDAAAPGNTPVPAVAPDAAPTPAAASASKPAPASDAAKSTPPPPVAPVPEVLKLKIEDGKSTHLKIVTDGKTVYDARLKAKTAKTFQARNSIEIRSKEMSALSIELNGKSVPVPSVASGQPFTLTHKDLPAAAVASR